MIESTVRFVCHQQQLESGDKGCNQHDTTKFGGDIHKHAQVGDSHVCTSCIYGLWSTLDEKGVLARPPAAHTHHLAAAAELQRGYLRIIFETSELTNLPHFNTHSSTILATNHHQSRGKRHGLLQYNACKGFPKGCMRNSRLWCVARASVEYRQASEK